MIHDPIPQPWAIVDKSNDRGQGLDVSWQRLEISGVGEIDEDGGAGQEEEDGETEDEGSGGHDELFDRGMHDCFGGSIGVGGEIGVLVG